MRVEKHSVPNGTESLEFVDSGSGKVTCRERAVLELVEDLVGRVDAGESIVIKGCILARKHNKIKYIHS